MKTNREIGEAFFYRPFEKERIKYFGIIETIHILFSIRVLTYKKKLSCYLYKTFHFRE